MNIVTKRLVLRALEPEDAKSLADLVNDPEVRDSLGAYNLVFPTSTELETRWIAEAGKKYDESNLAITGRRDGRLLGLVSLKEMNEKNASAHLSIMIERRSWNKGYGAEAIIDLLKYVFERMNIHRVWLRVDEGNARAIRCYEKCGFKKEGKLRQDHFAHGAWRSSYIMSVLAGESRGRRR